jgi:4'-phosphopantetheinyl transferase
LKPQESIDPVARSPAPSSLADGEIHVRAASLQLAAEQLAGLADTLSAAEKERAGKFKFDRHRNRFIAGRGWLRATLAAYLQTNPARLDFVYSVQGKPALSPEFDPAQIHFNLAHSEDLALLAITRIGPVGIDVERIRQVKDAAELVARFFCARENELFQQLPASEKPAAFFNLWTRKEALLKATGEGIGKALSEVEVSFLPGEPARLVGIAGDADRAAQWRLHELSPAPGYVGAVAIQAPSVCVRL